MAFLLGSFASGVAAGANNAMDIYSKYTDLMNKKNAANAVDAARNADKGSAAGNANSDSAISGGAGGGAAAGSGFDDSPIPDVNTQPNPRKNNTAVSSVLSTVGQGVKSAFGNVKSDAANGTQGQAIPTKPVTQPGAISNPQFAPNVSTSPSNMTTYDVPSGSPGALNGPSPPGGNSPVLRVNNQPGVASGPGDMSQLTNRPVGAAIGDWIRGRSSAPTYIQGQAVPARAPGSNPQPSAPARAAPMAGAPSNATPNLSGTSPSLGQQLLNAIGAGASQPTGG